MQKGRRVVVGRPKKPARRARRRHLPGRCPRTGAPLRTGLRTGGPLTVGQFGDARPSGGRRAAARSGAPRRRRGPRGAGPTTPSRASARDHIGRTCAGRGAHRRRRGHAPRRRTSQACRRASPSGRGQNRNGLRSPRRSRARRCLRRDRGGATPPPRVRRRSAAPIAGSARVRRRRRPLQCCAGGIERPSNRCLAPSSIRLPGRARRPTTTRRMKDGGEGNPVRILLDMLPRGRRKHRLDRARHAVHQRVVNADQATERAHI